jgi:hypothetical protein
MVCLERRFLFFALANHNHAKGARLFTTTAPRRITAPPSQPIYPLDHDDAIPGDIYPIILDRASISKREWIHAFVQATKPDKATYKTRLGCLYTLLGGVRFDSSALHPM